MEHKSGQLRVLAGPTASMEAMRAAAGRLELVVEVIVGTNEISWTSPQGSRAVVPAPRIRDVVARDRAVLVWLDEGGPVLGPILFDAESEAAAHAWADSIQEMVSGAACAAEAWQGVESSAQVTTLAGQEAFTSPLPVKVTYIAAPGAKAITRDYALLVIACDPRSLIGVCDFTSEEESLFEPLTAFTFHTTLMEVNVNQATWLEHGVIFSPAALEPMSCAVYGFRNETAKCFGLETAQGMQTNLVTVYQLGPVGATESDFARELGSLAGLDWWPFGAEYQVRTSVLTPYFDHFTAESLRADLPWQLLAAQGRRQTLLVHASTCFESALHCWQYAGMLLEVGSAAQRALPVDRHAPIAIVGAGVSGLLLATRLTRLGYTEIDLLESTDRYGGKTHTIVESSPAPPNLPSALTYCELGTCYLSPAYDEMVAELSTFLTGNDRLDFTGGNAGFRGIVTQGQFPSSFGVAPVINFDDYVILKAAAELGLGDDAASLDLARVALAAELAWYVVLHYTLLGPDLPMPAAAPPALQGDFGQQTYLEFLRAHNLAGMAGSLQYGYEVQGYGDLDTIPAYYGLLWITPKVVLAMLADAIKVSDEPIVTAWSKGWGDVWDQIVQKQDLAIQLNVQITSITRT